MLKAIFLSHNLNQPLDQSLLNKNIQWLVGITTSALQDKNVVYSIFLIFFFLIHQKQQLQYKMKFK